MAEKELPIFRPSSRQHWREWLHAHHAEQQGVWLVYSKKKSGIPSLTWSEAVDEALCFGWIDSKAESIDEHTYQQFFCPRKPKSGWSRINKEKIERLLAADLLAPAGLASIETAQQNGSWTLLDAVEALHIPPDLAEALQQRPGAETYFASLSRTDKRNMLQWLVLAKRPETRQKRVTEIAESAEQQLKPEQFRGRKQS
ncbi:YdeI/OmpD-associated family protein [Hymenobacter aerilatus]|uniref:YdeI/OmpD-associated family protein n=1 Tax=Hymenobacter aerilatus TaxID=2932251 RepID=A0A8T9SS25_9BACT|nr:YdeI/OmpD-associated family protein [Hymenobacter aerilatus]UOR04912.1 YdeI/OmpD-associated family protein [Hymenobacter aerilatus]